MSGKKKQKHKEINMSSNWGLDTELLEKTKRDSVAVVGGGFKPLDSGSYKVAIDKMYINTTDSGAQMMNLTFKIKDSEKLIFAKYCTRSGDEKGNKATFTILASHPEFLKKKYAVGSECPLPDYKFITQLFAATKSEMIDNAPEEGMIKIGDNTISAKIFKTMIGKELTVCGQVQESEYNGEVSEKFVPVVYLDTDGLNADGDEMVEKFNKKIEKEPVKRLKQKTVIAKAQPSGDIPF